MQTFYFWIGNRLIASGEGRTESEARQSIRDHVTIYVNRPYQTPYEFLGELNRAVAKTY